VVTTFLEIYTERGDTGSKSSIGVNDAGAKFACGVIKTGGNLPPMVNNDSHF
jgi:hypothetical protein